MNLILLSIFVQCRLAPEMNRTLIIESRFATKDFTETRGGLYLCGINWGGTDEDEMAEMVRRRQSFFSDDAVGTYPYRERILKWFDLWGVPLNRSKEAAGFLERAISQTNWLSDRSKRSEHRTQPKYLIEHIEEFLDVVRAKNPRVIFLYGSCLGVALEKALLNEEHRIEVEDVFGVLREAPEEFIRCGPGEPKFKVRRFKFELCEILCFPHPTGAKGVTNTQMARYKPEVKRALMLLEQSQKSVRTKRHESKPKMDC